MAEKTEDKGGEVATPDALEQVEALRRRVQDSGAAVEEANRRAQAAADLATAAAAEVTAMRTESAVATRTSALDDANREMTDLQSKYEEASTAADSKVMAELAAKMGRVGGRIERLETEAATRPTAADTGRVAARPTDGMTQERWQQLSANGFVGASTREAEMFLSQRTPQTAAWLRQHPEYFQDAKVNRRVRAADMEWDGPKDTPEYFNFIEGRIGVAADPARTTETEQGRTAGRAGTKPAADTGTEGTATTLSPAGANESLPAGRRAPPQAGRGGRQAPMAAPPSRDGAPNLSGRGNSGEKRITPEMQAWAKMMYPPSKDNPEGGIDPELYYDEYMRLKDEGEINDRFGRG